MRLNKRNAPTTTAKDVKPHYSRTPSVKEIKQKVHFGDVCENMDQNYSPSPLTQDGTVKVRFVNALKRRELNWSLTPGVKDVTLQAHQSVDVCKRG